FAGRRKMAPYGTAFGSICGGKPAHRQAGGAVHTSEGPVPVGGTMPTWGVVARALRSPDYTGDEVLEITPGVHPPRVPPRGGRAHVPWPVVASFDHAQPAHSSCVAGE